MFVVWKGYIYPLEFLNVPNPCGQNSENEPVVGTGKKAGTTPVRKPTPNHPWRKTW
ncbi:MAG: hypothetical protein ACPLOV_02070 [Thermovenabulum sp.]